MLVFLEQKIKGAGKGATDEERKASIFLFLSFNFILKFMAEHFFLILWLRVFLLIPIPSRFILSKQFRFSERCMRKYLKRYVSYLIFLKTFYTILVKSGIKSTQKWIITFPWILSLFHWQKILGKFSMFLCFT